MNPTLDGASVLVTGGTGAFGQAFVRHALDAASRRVVVFSRSESKQAAMRQAFGDDERLRFFIGDVRDERRVLDAMRGVTVCVHAAALKRVETCEADPNEAIATNVAGTQHVARACIERGVERAVFLSTDKAASPNTLYGATKLTAERLWVRSNVYAAGTPTRFAATRYGNVLGSTGSVVPLWQRQVATGEPITLTDPAMSRFWMTMADAVDLVAFALARMKGGEVFVPKIGSAWLDTLADAIGGPEHPRTVVGLRTAEKRHETLIGPDELPNCVDRGTHYELLPETPSLWPGFPDLPTLPPHGYRSDTNPQQLSAADLARMLTPSLSPREHARG